MSTKTYFKRISLAVILALSFGALSSAPSQALVAGTTAVSLSAATDSRIATETSSVTITASFTSTSSGTSNAVDTLLVTVVGTGATGAQATNTMRPSVTDSLNITTGVTDSVTPANAGLTFQPSAANTFTRVKVTFSAQNVSVVGTHVYTVNVSVGGSILASTTYTVTVAAANTDATAGQSVIWLNQVLPSGSTYNMSDSTLVVRAKQEPDLSLATPERVAYLAPTFRNSIGESVVTTNGQNVSGTMTVKITSGPGLLSCNSTDATKVRQCDISRGESVSVWTDGASGVATITSYIGSTPLTQAAKTITFYGKATSFVATANAVTKAGYNLSFRGLTSVDTVNAGNDILSFIATDATGLAVPNPSQNRAGVFYVNTSDTKIVRSTTSATDNKATCTISATASEAAAGKYYCDMYVIESGTVTLTVMDSITVAASTYTSNEITVTIAGPAVAGTLGFSKLGTTCTPGLTSTGTFEPGESVTMCVTAKDGLGRNAGQTSLSGASHDPFSWTILSPAQDKPFWIGGSNVNSDGSITTGGTQFSTLTGYLATSTFVNGVETVTIYMPTTSGDINIKGATGDTSAATATNYTAVTATLKVTGGAAQAAADAAAAAAKAAQDAAVAAAEKGAAEAVAAAKAAEAAAVAEAKAAQAAAVAAAEKGAAEAVAAAKAAQAAAVAAADKAAAAAKAAQDAAVAEAQAATDAAAEAIDAANAATDAANLAAEAADAATVAAEEARDAADAATAAVEELATQVASLMAALKAQITTLANTVVKIAKKVKA